MRIEKQNRRSCIVLLLILAALLALVVWMSVGGFSSQSIGDDVKTDVGAPGPGDPAAPAPARAAPRPAGS